MLQSFPEMRKVGNKGVFFKMRNFELPQTHQNNKIAVIYLFTKPAFLICDPFKQFCQLGCPQNLLFDITLINSDILLFSNRLRHFILIRHLIILTFIQSLQLIFINLSGLILFFTRLRILILLISIVVIFRFSPSHHILQLFAF